VLAGAKEAAEDGNWEHIVTAILALEERSKQFIQNEDLDGNHPQRFFAVHCQAEHFPAKLWGQ